MKEIRTILHHYAEWSDEKIPLALATVVRTEASSYRRVGARMLVGSDGRWVGGISGGCLEGDALRRARAAIFKGEPSLRTYDTREGDDPVIGVGLGCQGRIDVLFTPLNTGREHNAVTVLEPLVSRRRPSLLFTLNRYGNPHPLTGLPYHDREDFARDCGLPEQAVATMADTVTAQRRSQLFQLADRAGSPREILIEWIRPETRLVAVGDNYDTLALGELCQALGWELHLVGVIRKFGRAHHRLAITVRDHAQLSQLKLDEHTAVVIMSHDYQRDLTALKHFLPQQTAYLGLLGPAKRRDKLLAELQRPVPDKLFAPVGLDLGAESPEEIALAICAEVTRHFRGASGAALKNKRGSIHARPSS